MNLRKVVLLCGFFALVSCMPTEPIARPTRSGPLPLGPPPGPVADPKVVLEAAIQARGGEAVLKRLMQNYCTGQGHSIMLNQPQKFRFKTHSALPDRIRDESLYDNGVQFLQVVNGGKGWTRQHGVVADLDPVNLQSIKELLYTNTLMTLVPLRDARYTLVPLPEQRQDGHLCQAFLVQAPGQRDVTFYFDKETHLPLMLKTTSLDPNQLEAKVQETYFRDYQVADGLHFPMRWVIYNDRNKAMELRFTEVKMLDKVDDAFFAKPQ